MRISDWSSDVGSSDLRSPVAVARFDREHPLAAPDAALHGVTHILLSIPPDDEGDPALASHGGDIVRLAGPTFRWVGYLSTTGGYGDRGGAREIGRAARRGRVCQYEYNPGDDVSLQQNANRGAHTYRRSQTL